MSGAGDFLDRVVTGALAAPARFGADAAVFMLACMLFALLGAATAGTDADLQHLTEQIFVAAGAP